MILKSKRRKSEYQCDGSATQLTRLRAEIERLKKALEDAKKILGWYAETRAEIERKSVMLRSSFKGPDPATACLARIDAALEGK